MLFTYIISSENDNSLYNITLKIKTMDIKSFREVHPVCCFECGHCKHLSSGYYFCELHNEYLTDEDEYVVEHVCDDFA